MWESAKLNPQLKHLNRKQYSLVLTVQSGATLHFFESLRLTGEPQRLVLLVVWCA